MFHGYRGCSGFKIQIDSKSNTVYKYSELPSSVLYSQYLWLKQMYELYPSSVVRVFSWDGSGYYMEDLSNYGIGYIIGNREDSVKSLIKFIDLMKDMKPIFGKNSFLSFIDRLDKHIKYCSSITDSIHNIFVNGVLYDKFNYEIFRNKISRYIIEFDSYISNCHGDMTLENVYLDRYKNTIVIDSNHLIDCWNSFLLDIAKLRQSTRTRYENIFYDRLFTLDFRNNSIYLDIDLCKTIEDSIVYEYYRPYMHLVNLLCISNYIRMLKYKLNISMEDFYVAFAILCILNSEE